MSSECGVWIAKYALCIFNFIFFILGTITLGTGIWLAVDKPSLISLLKMVENDHVHKFTQPQVIEQLAYVLIVIGALMFLLSFLGYCGAIRESRCMLMTYAVLVILLVIAEVVTGCAAALYKDKASNETQAYLKTTIKDYYTAGPRVDAVTLAWNQMMSTFGCCGVNDYRDFETSQLWLANRGNTTLPPSCCVLKDVQHMVPRDADCVTNPTDSNSFYKKGCYPVFRDWISSHLEIIIGVLVGTLIVQLIVILLAICLFKAFSRYHNMRL